MPTKRIKREREPLPVQYPAQFSVMVDATSDTQVRTIARNRSRTLSAVMREAVGIGLAEMVERGDMDPPAKRVRKARAQRAAASNGAEGA